MLFTCPSPTGAIVTPASVFPLMTLRAVAVAPPMTVPVSTPDEVSSRMPERVLVSLAVPPAASPIKLPARVLVFVPPPRMYTPYPVFPEMTLPAPVPGVAVSPPTVLSCAPDSIRTPVALPTDPVPVRSVPTKLPATTVPVVPLPVRNTPAPTLPEIRLPAPAKVPPTVTPVLPNTPTPPATLATAAVPEAFVPMRLPAITVAPLVAPIATP